MKGNVINKRQISKGISERHLKFLLRLSLYKSTGCENRVHILVVLITLVLLFKEQIIGVMNNILEEIAKKSQTIY